MHIVHFSELLCKHAKIHNFSFNCIISSNIEKMGGFQDR